MSFETEKEALKEKSKLERKFNPEERLTVERLIERYLVHPREVKGNRKWTYENCGLRLRQFFRDHLTHSASRFTPEKAEEIYHQHVSRKHFRTGNRLSDATQQGDCTTGGRTNEVLKRIIADLDEGGAVLIVREREASEQAGEATVKNTSSRRRLFLHPQVQPLVAKLGRDARLRRCFLANTDTRPRRKTCAERCTSSVPRPGCRR